MNPGSETASKLGPVQIGLRKDIEISRQRDGGEVCYIAHDPVTFQNHSFNALEYRVMTAIVADRNLKECFQSLVSSGVLSEQHEGTFFDFVLQLHSMHMIQLPIVQADKLFERYTRKKEAQRRGWYRVFLYHKIPLLNPDRFLQRTMNSIGWMFSKGGVALWVMLMGLVFWKCWDRLPQLFAQTGDMLMLSNLPILWLTLIGLKVIHEFGHAYICRRLGGQVPEMGVVFIFLTPCAYVDASSSWRLDNRWKRIAVAAGGMYIECFVAGIFALIWAGTQAGLMQDIALNVVVLASLVTVLFNINPLIKFDGYFILSDLLGLVNLQEEATHKLKATFKRFALGLPHPQATKAKNRRERWSHALYAPSSFIYRVSLAITVSSLVLFQWPAAGPFVGIIFAWALMFDPIRKGLRYLWCGEETEPVRTRARLVAMGLAGVLPIALAFMPISNSIVVPGVLDPQVQVSVRAAVNGFVTSQPARPGTTVTTGDLLCELENPDFDERRLHTHGEAEAVKIRLDVTEIDEQAQAATHRARLDFLNSTIKEQNRKLAAMTVTAPTSGIVVAGESEDWIGRWIHPGDELFQVHGDNRHVRIVLTDEQVMRSRLEIGSTAQVRWSCQPNTTVQATVREVRRSSSRHDVPIEVTMLAGGEVYAEPIQGNNTRADQPYLHVFLEIDSAPMEMGGSGLTSRVRLDARVETLAGWMRRTVLNFVNAWKMS